MAGTGVAIAVGDAIPLLDDNGSGSYIKGRNTAHDFRMGLLGGQFQQQADGITARPGVLISRWDGATYDFDVVPQSTPDQTVTVKAGRAIVPRAGQGGYLITMEADQVITMPAASTSNSRYDIICLAMFDKGSFASDAAHGPQIWVESGSLGGGVPATPTGMLKIREVFRAVNDNAIGTGELTDKRYVTGIHQGIRPYVASEVNGANIVGQPGVVPNEIRFGPASLERWNITLNGGTGGWEAITYPLGSNGYAEYSQTVAQAVPNSTDTRMNWDRIDILSGGDITTAPVGGGTEFTVNRPGVWLISGTMRWNGGFGAGTFQRAAILSTTSAIAYRFGGMNNYEGDANASDGLKISMQQGFAGQHRFAAGDKFSVWLYQIAGGTISTNVTWASRIQMSWLRP